MALSSKPIKTAGLLLAVFSFSVLQAQENNEKRDAEQLFDQYHKFGLIVGGSLLFVTNEPNPVDLRYETVGAFNYGIEYNFLQTGNFNFKVALLRRVYAIKSTERFKKEDTGLSYDIGGKLTTGDYLQTFVPLTAEFLLPINQSLSLNFGLGPEFTIRPVAPPNGGPQGFGSSFVIIDGMEIGYRKIYYYQDERFYVGANASVGLNWETKPLLFRLNLTYHYQPETLYTIIATTQNLMVSKNTVSRHEITGNYLMLSLSIIPSRDLFKGKRKKEE